MTEGVSTKPLMGKEALIKRIESAFAELQRALQSLDKSAMSKPLGNSPWTSTDILAHIAGWEDILVRFHLGGEPFDEVIDMEGAQYRKTSFDDINDHIYAHHKGLTVEQAWALLYETHTRVLQALESFPEEQLHQAHPQLSTGEYASLNWIDYIIANTYEHYEEHLAML